jgi:hypothetical protein
MDSDVVNSLDANWESEDIPSEDSLLMRVHQTFLDDEGEPIPAAFRNQPPKTGGMSTDWERYSTPEETMARAREPMANIVIALLTGAVRGIPNQVVVHTPDAVTRNRAHTDVFGEKTVEVREGFMRIYRRVSLENGTS